MFEFYGIMIDLMVDEGGVTVLLYADEADSLAFHSTSHDPLCLAALLRSELDLLLHEELEELAGLIDAHM